MKVCSKCGIEKENTYFCKDNSRKDRLYPQCSGCHNKSNRKWDKSNIKKKRLSDKNYRMANRSKIFQRIKEKEKTDINYRLCRVLRSRTGNAIKSNQKSGSFVRDLGCSVQELKERLEKQWQSGMTWANWTTDGWHIDHIKPLDSFDLTDRKEFLEACHYTNLQPLWAKDNLAKSSKI